ncbi:MAG: hypothetical protein R3C15_07530 [Thermoleophilia bacterium]
MRVHAEPTIRAGRLAAAGLDPFAAFRRVPIEHELDGARFDLIVVNNEESSQLQLAVCAQRINRYLTVLFSRIAQ